MTAKQMTAAGLMTKNDSEANGIQCHFPALLTIVDNLCVYQVYNKGQKNIVF